MNGTDLLTAIAGTAPEYLTESQRFGEIGDLIQADLRQKKRRVSMIGISSLFCIAAIAVWRIAPFTPRVPVADDVAQSIPEDFGTADISSAEGEIPADTTATAITEPSAGERTQPSDILQPPTETVSDAPDTNPPSAENTTATSATPGGPGTANAVYTEQTADYNTAKQTFGYPIIQCDNADFIGYKIGIVSRNGDVNADGAFCLSVVYEFANGSVSLQDQDRMTGSAASTFGDRYDYRGRTFYVNMLDAAPRILVGYFPTWDSGIAYQADFAPDSDIYNIMDLIISVEF